jgi:hypothetical protein
MIAELHPKLRRAQAKFQRARDEWHRALRETQAVCKHEIWVCQDGHSGMIFDHPSIQICAACRAEMQTGTYDGWERSHWRRPKFVHFVVTPSQMGVASDNICALRLRDDPRGFQRAADLASGTAAGTATDSEAGVAEGKGPAPQGDAQ